MIFLHVDAEYFVVAGNVVPASFLNSETSCSPNVGWSSGTTMSQWNFERMMVK